MVGVLLWGVLTGFRPRSPATRYAVCCVALLALATLPFFTVATLWGAATEPLRADVTVANAANAANAAVRSTALPQTLLTFWLEPERPRIEWLAFVQQWVLPIWLAGVFVLSVRLARDYTQTLALRRGNPLDDEVVLAAISRLSNRLGIRRRVRVIASTLIEGPSVVGWLRPAILLPPAVAMGLTTEQLEAVLAHELAHVRRHDYLVNLLQSVVETLFFYHPVVWWVSNRIRDERELCCDDVAVRSSGDPVGYARALATLARRRLDAPALVTAATGGSLLYRVQRLVGRESRDDLPSRVPAVVAVAVAIGCMVLNLDWLSAQGGEQPRFDVTSVKPNVSNDGLISNTYRDGRLTARGFTAAGLIRSAYQVQEFQIVGGPEWIDRDRFDIVAVSEADAARATAPQPPGQSSRAQLMLRALLADRFGLAVRKERREMPVYALVLTGNDSRATRLPRSAIDCSALAASTRRGEGPGRPEGPPPCSSSVAPGRVTARGRTMAQFAAALSMLTNTGTSLNRLVVDRTGLPGSFDFDLTFTPDSPPDFGPTGVPRGMPPIDLNGPSIFTALQEQLGLKLEPQRGPVDVLVVEQVRQPDVD
jgi:bla regulator protein blaR1